jgi:hypothetical protein
VEEESIEGGSGAAIPPGDGAERIPDGRVVRGFLGLLSLLARRHGIGSLGTRGLNRRKEDRGLPSRRRDPSQADPGPSGGEPYE